MKNNFDLKNIEDIPNNLKKELKLNRISSHSKKLLSLFEKKNILCIDEIIVGLYRLYKLEKTRTWVSYTLYNLNKKINIIKSPNKKGYYEKLKETE